MKQEKNKMFCPFFELVFVAQKVRKKKKKGKIFIFNLKSKKRSDFFCCLKKELLDKTK
jgi:hypothetical protein